MPTAVYLVNKCPAFIKPIPSLRYFFLEPNGRIQYRIHQSRHWQPTSRPVDGYITSWPLLFPVALRPYAGHGLLILEVCWPHTTTHHSRQDSSGRVISSSQRPLHDNTRQSQQTNIHVPGGIRTHDLSRRATADRAATGIGFLVVRHGHYTAMADAPHGENAGQNTITRT